MDKQPNTELLRNLAKALEKIGKGIDQLIEQYEGESEVTEEEQEDEEYPDSDEEDVIEHEEEDPPTINLAYYKKKKATSGSPRALRTFEEVKEAKGLIPDETYLDRQREKNKQFRKALTQRAALQRPFPIPYPQPQYPNTPNKRTTPSGFNLNPVPPSTRISRKAASFTSPAHPKAVKPTVQKKTRAATTTRKKPTKSKTTKGPSKRVKCGICGYSAPDIGALSKHRAKKHPNAAKKSAKKGATKRVSAKQDPNEIATAVLTRALQRQESGSSRYERRMKT